MYLKVPLAPAYLFVLGVVSRWSLVFLQDISHRTYPGRRLSIAII